MVTLTATIYVGVEYNSTATAPQGFPPASDCFRVMPSAPAELEAAEELVADRPDPKAVLRRSFIKGLAILLPLFITLMVVSFLLGFIFQQIGPIVDAVVGVGLVDSEIVVAFATVVVFLLVVLAIGFVAEYAPGDHHLSDDLDHFMASLPGVGSVYSSFNEMTELLLDSDTDSFQDVKLVEYPGTNSYVVAFKTAETPDVIADETDNEDMITLFMPMAPNPVMGGFVIHASRERVVDVDLTVEEGIRSIVTSGVAIGHDEETMTDVSEGRVHGFGDLDDSESVVRVDGTPVSTPGDEDGGRRTDDETDGDART
jgi:uncharacterized membrane protein